MFTIEHDFDATVITLVDEGSPHLELRVEYRRSHFCAEQIEALLTGFEDAVGALATPEEHP